MELKKGDVVAVVAEVVAESDGKIIISIPGATVSEDLIIAPRKPIRVLERSASPGDSVMYKDEIPCIYRRNETQNVVSLVREGMPHDDPTSYLFANIKDIRRIDQEGTVKFVSTERHFPNAETGREAMDRMKSEEDVEATQQDEQADNGSAAPAAPEILEVPTAREDELELPTPITETATPLPVLLPPETGKAPTIEADAPNTETDLEIDADADADDDSASDKITIEMPEGFPPRRPVVEEAVQAPPAAADEEEAVEQAPAEEISSEESVNATEDASAEEQDRPVSDSDEKEDKVVLEPESEAMAAPAIEGASDADVTEESEAVASEPELTEEEIEEKNRRVNKLRQETITNLSGDEGNSPEAPKPASIFDDIDDLDSD